MNFTQAYNYLLSLGNIVRQEYLTDSSHCELYLKRLRFFLNLLGHPEKQIPRYIHVAGTSGKGSVCLMLSSILKQTGQKVGVITSPHPSTITERWEINGRPISQKKFIALIEFIKPKLDEYSRTSPYDLPSFFEITTALGLLYFAQEKIDWAIVEVGLGGRFDSTNVIPNRDICLITNIGLDHQNIIGPTKKDIAYEKAGIIKRDCAVLTMEKNPAILKIFQKECAQQKSQKLRVIKYDEKEFKIMNHEINKICFKYKNQSYFLPVSGAHQIKNAILAIEASNQLKIARQTIRQGLKKIKLPLRLQTVSRRPLIILDGAHNPDKMKTTIQAIKEIKYLKNQPIHLIVGFSADKNWLKMAKQLAGLNLASIACTRFTNNIFRKTANPPAITRQFKKLSPKTKIEMFLDPAQALKWSKRQNKKNHGLILTTGSFFLSGEIKLLLS
ncbi:MAG: hypothetical protein COU31_01620 [Candidatus Magasanikbacteria bacterium CG10_big_fil_rev_8_21_14_0_10_40_10]|uniref:tetrahydrofolate synthase n=1 Tax=Candidatus Magasanikbacteria bacterium CG10_big_fil_rev_8_21_14_0_10_40_10 TaxID=1974648 RepID=A0A2M6W4A2_9BACT|nr:MAG: hypothetical protein COU31_01620 [Candidatus Magasanikbacteria bacterium CG10_big_fil_rev_8_21_14_0_10_40_10]